MRDWKDIDSAPKDTSILIYGKDYGVCESWYDTERKMWFILDGRNNEEVWIHDFFVNKAVLTSVLVKPSHWMPLPQPPESETK